MSTPSNAIINNKITDRKLNAHSDEYGILKYSKNCLDSSSGREEDGDDEENLCPICLGGFEDQMVGIPENCGHIFCITCIQEWSKVS